MRACSQSWATQDGFVLGASAFKEWFDAEFVVDGTRYPTAEHFMMAEKARLFHDESELGRILQARNPAVAKAAGREVQGFDEEV